MKQLRLFIIPALLMVLTSTAVSHAQAAPRWIEADQEYNARIHLYFFWSKKCPHCLEALSELSQMERDYPWLSLHSLELTEYPDNVKQYLQMAETFEIQARSVPAFFYCGKYSIGYQSAETTGIHLRNNILQCYKQASDNPTTTPSLKRPSQKSLKKACPPARVTISQFCASESGRGHNGHARFSFLNDNYN